MLSRLSLAHLQATNIRPSLSNVVPISQPWACDATQFAPQDHSQISPNFLLKNGQIRDQRWVPKGFNKSPKQPRFYAAKGTKESAKTGLQNLGKISLKQGPNLSQNRTQTWAQLGPIQAQNGSSLGLGLGSSWPRYGNRRLAFLAGPGAGQIWTHWGRVGTFISLPKLGFWVLSEMDSKVNFCKIYGRRVEHKTWEFEFQSKWETHSYFNTNWGMPQPI